jgi:hypothetical protein
MKTILAAVVSRMIPLLRDTSARKSQIRDKYNNSRDLNVQSLTLRITRNTNTNQIKNSSQLSIKINTGSRESQLKIMTVVENSK